MNTNELAILLRDQRKKLQLTQKEMGERVGLKQKTISALENNPENASIRTLQRVLAALEMDMQLTPKNAADETKMQWDNEW
ncbi:helix-turn-helix domain-containing protein [Legionella taurinensis]|uniref:Helix-turn-helix domain-containing protein n=1 Tax=Legionella taurinensis TaxID=70611 RepID=A0A3A5L828_9GAMM|nr:helix-turn-helix domain-containing protein [Legionella taurinensis]MDX1836680.1 helix-turn-helix domain-containing protein [Legionella taurinensis]PUT42865.1 transcriptional regulator [Legionella taurinensis]PUT45420.1 transcriptional regulator [Legionella taurinensis]PUT47005.1 transcriptional regulator [Legionella taurinensis]PUT49187.1 transcriptional regulator [Legionella taurinensis]